MSSLSDFFFSKSDSHGESGNLKQVPHKSVMRKDFSSVRCRIRKLNIKEKAQPYVSAPFFGRVSKLISIYEGGLREARLPKFEG